MGEFGAGVSALLETYGKCLELLKAFKGQHAAQSKKNNDDDAAAAADAHSQLRKSVRSDRSRVRAAYSARVWKEGNRMSRGDCELLLPLHFNGLES